MSASDLGEDQMYRIMTLGIVLLMGLMTGVFGGVLVLALLTAFL